MIISTWTARSLKHRGASNVVPPHDAARGRPHAQRPAHRCSARRRPVALSTAKHSGRYGNAQRPCPNHAGLSPCESESDFKSEPVQRGERSAHGTRRARCTRHVRGDPDVSRCSTAATPRGAPPRGAPPLGAASQLHTRA